MYGGDFSVWVVLRLFLGACVLLCVYNTYIHKYEYLSNVTVHTTTVCTAPAPPPVTGFFSFGAAWSPLFFLYEQWAGTGFLSVYRQLVTGNRVRIK